MRCATVECELPAGFHEAASNSDFGAEVVVEWIIQREQFAHRGCESRLRGFAEQLLLVLLLRLVATAIKRMQRTPWLVRAILRAAVPEMGIHNNDCSGCSRDESFLGMCRRRIVKHVLGSFSPTMRTGYDSRRAVFDREIIQHPYHIGNPESPRIGQRRHIDVQWLSDVLVWVSGTRIGAAEFELWSEHRREIRQDFRSRDSPAKHLSFVNEVRKPTAAGLGHKLLSGLVAFFVKQFFDAVDQFSDAQLRNDVLQNEESAFIELPLLVCQYGR
jgi:hypothetical protein